jgi:hypothetical protein
MNQARLSEQAAFETRLSQLSTPKRTIPEAKTNVGDDCSTQDERLENELLCRRA